MKFLCAPLMLFFIITSFAQQKTLVRIDGIILEETKNTPLEYATISLKNNKTNSVFLGGLSNSKGKFTLSVTKGNYQISIEYLGFKPTIIPITITNHTSLGKLYLKPDSSQLNEVQLSNNKSIRLNKGKISLIASKDVSSKGNNALEILNNLPSVNADNTGMVTVDGFKQATILINGKKSGLSKSDILKTISAASIKNIDVVSHPGAQYRANEQAIINIVLKRGKNEGLHGSVTTTIGYKDQHGILVNTHHKSKKVNLYANISAARKKDYLDSEYDNEYYNTTGAIQSYLDQKISYDNTKDTYFANFGAEFYITDRTIINADINLYTIKSNAFTQTNSLFYPSTDLNSTINQLSKNNHYKDNIFEVQVDLKHQFNNEGTFNLTLTQTLDKEEYLNDFYNSNSSIKFANTLDKNYLKNTQISSKYTQAISKTSIMTVGYSADIGSSPFDHYSDAGDSKLKYQETVHAGFVEYEYEKANWYVGMGLRAEIFDVKTDYISENQLQKRNYKDLFPTIYIQRELNDYSNISFDYSSKISRPSFYKIQPFIQVTSETSYFSGNPELAPFYMDNYAVTYTYSKFNFTIRPSIRYSKFKDARRNVTYETGRLINGVSSLITQPFNVGDIDYFVANITALYRASNKLNFTLNTNLMHIVNNGDFNIINSTGTPIYIDYNNTNTNADVSLTTQLSLAKGLSIQNRIYYRLDSKGPVSERKKYAYATLSLSKDVWKKNGTISFTSNDIFNSNRTKRTYFNDYYTSESQVKNKYPTYLLSFTYRFNQRKNRQKINFNKKDQTPKF